MRRLILASTLVMSSGSLIAFADNLTGYVSEAHCGAKHNTPSDANTACVKKCLSGGSTPVLVSNGKVMKFDTDSQEKAKAFAGDNVKIDGSVEGDTIKINAIEKAQ